MHGIYIQYVFSGVINFLFTFLLLKVNPFNRTGLLLITLPLILLLVPQLNDIINKNFFPGFIGMLMYLISTIFGYLLYKKFKIKIIVAYLFVYIALVYNFNNINNYYYTSLRPKLGDNLNFHNIIFHDAKGNKIVLEKNKIYVVDIWSLSCGVCIENFPKFKKVEGHYKNNNDVKVITLNILNSENQIIKSEEIIKNFDFNNYYINKNIFKYLNFNSIPQYLIVNKKGEVKYLGLLNIELMSITITFII